ncbi:MAG: pyruvate carboxylase subunit B [Chloroflexi bacterium]|nr:pyruvate carboxylase subunit B [Chloroflexota bacterium]
MVAVEKKPLRITDTTSRDGHQSSLATRMRTEDIEAMAEDIDKVGFWSAEVWGGATFDVATRFLNEDPWQRPRLLKKLMPNTPLQMLLRGQNLVGYRNYADDVVHAFVHRAAEAGIDVFRVFDALNDERNFESAFAAIKECGKHIQGTLCYSLTERRLGGPIYNIDYFVKKALTIQDMGADSLCIKDMAGLIAPYDAYELIKSLKAVLHIPVQLHTHYTSGMASMSCLMAAEAGVDIIDAALAPFALRSSQPAVEPLVVALQGTHRDTGLDLELLFKLGQHLERIAPKYRDFLNTTKMAVIDTEVLMHQIPGGMTTNLVAQLREAGALERINEVYAELPRVRKELGYPPLVTPTSQIVGIQAVQNVLFGRYKIVSDQVKDYVYGLYGRPPVPVDAEVQQIVLKGYHRGEQPITCRGADILQPELEKAKEATRGLARDMDDVLIYALYPTTGLRFLRWKYGLEEAPAEVRPKTLEDIRREDELIARAKAGKRIDAPQKAAPARSGAFRSFDVFVDGEYYKVEVAPSGVVSTVASQPAAVAPAPAPAAATAPAKSPAIQAASVSLAEGEAALEAPMPGMVVRVPVKVGDMVKAGDTVVVFEAMKMQTALVAPKDGIVKAINFKEGSQAAKGDILAVIG